METNQCTVSALCELGIICYQQAVETWLVGVVN